MAGVTEETGTVQAVRLGDIQSKYPDMHVVIVSKSTKADAGTEQAADYEYKGYKRLLDTSHPDLIAMGKPLGDENGDPQTNYLAQLKEEREMANTFSVGREEASTSTVGQMMGKE